VGRPCTACPSGTACSPNYPGLCKQVEMFGTPMRPLSPMRPVRPLRPGTFVDNDVELVNTNRPNRPTLTPSRPIMEGGFRPMFVQPTSQTLPQNTRPVTNSQGK
jgi:hypothetical protein